MLADLKEAEQPDISANARGHQVDATSGGQRRRIVMLGVVIAVALIVVVVALFISRSKESTEIGTVVYPAGTSSTSLGAPAGTATAPVLDIYQDYQCPGCGAAERALGPTIDQLIQQGKLKVYFHPMIFIDDHVGNDSSLRSAAAFGCAVDAGKAVPYHAKVFANQPTPPGAGYTNEQLIAFGEAVGITGPQLQAFTQCVNDQRYAPWAQASDKESLDRGITAAPAFFVNGKELPTKELATPQTFLAALKQLSGQ
jgi:protein-disulfide isomerase